MIQVTKCLKELGYEEEAIFNNACYRWLIAQDDRQIDRELKFH